MATASGAFWVFSSCASTLTRTVGGAIVAPTASQNSLFTYLDSGGNQIFNTTARIYTDTDFHCSDEYTALAAVRSRIWPKVSARPRHTHTRLALL